MTRIFLLLLVLAAPAAARTLGEIEFKPCRVSLPHGAGYRAECAGLGVAENPAEPQGRRLRLRLALVPARTSKPKPDLLVLLAGGPGQSAVESYPQAAGAFAPLLRERSLLLVDQRGTGGSNKLSCPLPDYGEVRQLEPTAARVQAMECLKDIGDLADPVFYTTNDYIRDLETVRAALGSPQFNLLGGSYGTRVALEYLRRHPDALRSVVLDAVVPPELALLQEHSRNLDEAVARTFELCRKDPACLTRFGDPQKTLAELRAELKAHPRHVRFRDPMSNKPRDESMNDGSLAGVLRFFSYQPEAASLLPLLLDEARHDRPEALMAQLPNLQSLGDQLAHGMELSVICSEDADLLRADPADEARILGADMIPYVQAQCEIWPFAKRPADFKQPVRSGKPVLLLSGELDPVTPPRYGEQVLKHLDNARHLVARGQGHTVMMRGCVPRLVSEFISKLQPRELDASCLSALGYVPAFVSDQGPAP